MHVELASGRRLALASVAPPARRSESHGVPGPVVAARAPSGRSGKIADVRRTGRLLLVTIVSGAAAYLALGASCGLRTHAGEPPPRKCGAPCPATSSSPPPGTVDVGGDHRGAARRGVAMLVQMGQDRAGFYTYEWFENGLMRLNIPNAKAGRSPVSSWPGFRNATGPRGLHGRAADRMGTTQPAAHRRARSFVASVVTDVTTGCWLGTCLLDLAGGSEPASRGGPPHGPCNVPLCRLARRASARRVRASSAGI